MERQEVFGFSEEFLIKLLNMGTKIESIQDFGRRRDDHFLVQ